MEVTRRNFIQLSGTALLAVGISGSIHTVNAQKTAPGEYFPIPAESLSDPISYLTRAHFEPFLNTTFRVSQDEQTYDLQLVELPVGPEVIRSFNEKHGYYGESFSLILMGSRKTRLAPGLYTFEHPVLGTFSLSLNPVERKGEYQAVINRVNR